MKKIYTILSVSSIVLASFSFSSCSKESLLNNDCVALANAYYAAASEYTADILDSEKCEAFVQATENYINGCSILTKAQRESFQKAIDDSDCSDSE